jgi:hypothetical protein
MPEVFSALPSPTTLRFLSTAYRGTILSARLQEAHQQRLRDIRNGKGNSDGPDVVDQNHMFLPKRNSLVDIVTIFRDIDDFCVLFESCWRVA